MDKTKTKTIIGNDMDYTNKNENKNSDDEHETGERMTQDEIFGKKGSLQRTPPGIQRWLRNSKVVAEATPLYKDGECPARTSPEIVGQRRSSLPSAEELREYVRQPTKRMREDTPPQRISDEERTQVPRELTEIETIMQRLEGSYKELMNNIMDAPKTKLEVKETANRMRSNMEMLSRRIKEYREEQHVQVDNAKTVKTRTVEIQVCEEDIEEEAERRRVNAERETLEILQTKDTVEELKRIIDYEWPEIAFQRTRVIEGNIKDINTNTDVAFIVNNNSRKLQDEIGQRYPEVEEIIREGLVEGQMEYIRENRNLESSKGNRGQKCKTSYILPFNVDESGITDIEALQALMKQLLKDMKSVGLKSITLGILEGKLDKEYLRKIAEYVFHRTEIEVHLLEKKPILGSKTKAKTEKENSGIAMTKIRAKEYRNKSEKVIVKAQGKTYADLLKTVKSNVSVDEMEMKIQKVKKTKNGDLLLQVKGKENAERLKNAIKTKVNETEVIVKTNDVVLHIADIDADIDSESLKQEIINSTKNIREDDIKVLSLRPLINGDQAATIKVRREIGEDLAEKGRIKIGWSSCRIRKRVHLLRCFKCLQFGHRSSECKGEDKTDICINCGKAGHKARDCTHESYCTMCNASGHRADNTKCPHFRMLIKGKESKRTISSQKGENKAGLNDKDPTN